MKGAGPVSQLTPRPPDTSTDQATPQSGRRSAVDTVCTGRKHLSEQHWTCPRPGPWVLGPEPWVLGPGQAASDTKCVSKEMIALQTPQWLTEAPQSPAVRAAWWPVAVGQGGSACPCWEGKGTDKKPKALVSTHHWRQRPGARHRAHRCVQGEWQ